MGPLTQGGTTASDQRALAESVMGEVLNSLSGNPGQAAGQLAAAVDHIASGEKQAMIRDAIQKWIEPQNPGPVFLERVLTQTHPNVREKTIARMLASMLFRDPELRDRCERKYGITPPYVMLISPSMRCNYRCEGCYAASYERRDDMSPEVFDRLLSEAEDIGINFFIVLGGEPFIYPDLLPVIRNHDRSFFQIYTNGSFIDREMADELVKMGNIAPQISINGPREFTDASRVNGSYDICLEAMDNLREAGCVFGFSSLLTTHNVDAICSDEWVDFLIEKGALYGWLFLYMPVGGDPDISLMPAPEQRDRMRRFLNHTRQTKPILPIDFWNDGTLTGGCIAGGRLYFHINHRGDVEPCIFCHFATDNIHRCSLAEALGSPFFTGIKQSQPFSYNTLRPCPMIDNPGVMWQIINESGAQPTHEGADRMFTEFAPELEVYAEGVRSVMDDAWDNEAYHDWAARWTAQCGVPPEMLEARRNEYERSRRNSRHHK
ncbi:MAG: radical SAM protein [Dehalococcoidia bacterium]